MLNQAKLDAIAGMRSIPTGPGPSRARNVQPQRHTHALTAQGLVLTGKDLDRYLEHQEPSSTKHRPEGPTESFLVETLAEISWTVAAMRVQEQNLMTLIGQTGDDPTESSDPELKRRMAQATTAPKPSNASNCSPATSSAKCVSSAKPSASSKISRTVAWQPKYLARRSPASKPRTEPEPPVWVRFSRAQNHDPTRRRIHRRATP